MDTRASNSIGFLSQVSKLKRSVFRNLCLNCKHCVSIFRACFEIPPTEPRRIVFIPWKSFERSKWHFAKEISNLITISFDCLGWIRLFNHMYMYNQELWKRAIRCLCNAGIHPNRNFGPWAFYSNSSCLKTGTIPFFIYNYARSKWNTSDPCLFGLVGHLILSFCASSPRE